jgi:hypothetical protein
MLPRYFQRQYTAACDELLDFLEPKPTNIRVLSGSFRQLDGLLFSNPLHVQIPVPADGDSHLHRRLKGQGTHRDKR